MVVLRHASSLSCFGCFFCVCLFVLFFFEVGESDNFVMDDFLVQEQYVTPDLHLDF